MSVNTVNGEIDANELGVTDVHEHIFGNFLKDFRKPQEATKQYLAEQKVSMENLGILNINQFAIKDNLVLNDEKLAESELLEFKKAGGRTVVDATPAYVGRDPIALKRVSNALGINIIASTGFYRKRYHPHKVQRMSVEEISDWMTKEIEVGISDTGIRAGMIGELGTSEVIHPDEEKVLIATARVNKKLGVPVMVHLEPWKSLAMDVLKILSKNGANLEKVYLCHLDDSFYNYEYYESIIKTGAYIGFDTFGEFAILDPTFRCPSDDERIETLLKLLDDGYGEKILVGSDICRKRQLHKYGGWGYDHFLSNVLPVLRKKGITKELEKMLTIENPKNYLDVKK